MEEQKKNNKLILGLIGILVILIAIASTSYAIWYTNDYQDDENELTAGCFDLTFSDTKSISLNRAYPITNAQGMEMAPYTVTIAKTSECDARASYEIYLEVMNNSNIEPEYFKLAVDQNTPKIITTTNYPSVTKTLNDAKSAFKIYEGTLTTEDEITHEIRSWMDENTNQSTGENRLFEFKITVTAIAK